MKIFPLIPQKISSVFVQKVSLTAYLWQLLDWGRTHKLNSFLMLLHVLETSGSNGSKIKAVFFTSFFLWVALEPSPLNLWHAQPKTTTFWRLFFVKYCPFLWCPFYSQWTIIQSLIRITGERNIFMKFRNNIFTNRKYIRVTRSILLAFNCKGKNLCHLETSFRNLLF